MVPTSRKQLVTVCCVSQPLQTLQRGKMVPTMADGPSAPLSDKPLQTSIFLHRQVRDA